MCAVEQKAYFPFAKALFARLEEPEMLARTVCHPCRVSLLCRFGRAHHYYVCLITQLLTGESQGLRNSEPYTHYR